MDITTFAPLSVKGTGDFADILAQDNPAIWLSHRPAGGGETGEMFRKIVERALALREGRTPRDTAASAKRPPQKTTAASKRKPAAGRKTPVGADLEVGPPKSRKKKTATKRKTVPKRGR